MACIWCKSSANPTSVEHIFPEALGCPRGLLSPRARSVDLATILSDASIVR